jgi:hypothetical protein
MSLPLAKKLAFDRLSEWTFYAKINRLRKENFVMKRDGIGLQCEVLQLTKKGFDYLKYDLGELREMRYAAQSVAHDYWATAFQLGEFALSPPKNVEFLTEQQIICTDDSLLPRWQPKSREHVPDGMTCIRSGIRESVIAIEVELNLKPLIRYDKIGYYFESSLSKVDVVFWICATTKIAQTISDRLFQMKLRNFDIHQFVITSEFRNQGWDALIRSGSFNGRSIRDVYLAKGHQTPENMPKMTRKNELRQLLFPTAKTPKSSRTYLKPQLST